MVTLNEVEKAYRDALALVRNKGDLDIGSNPYHLTFDKFDDTIVNFLKTHSCYVAYWEDNDSWGEGYFVLAPHSAFQDLI